MILSKHQLIKLKQSLLFLNMSELRDLCIQLALGHTGKKILLIERILHFLSTGTSVKELSIPAISQAQRNTIYPLTPNTLILKGSYKNDLQTRNFFKSLIGGHFHFTAFGIDWINQRWLAGNPPTYQDYADMWQREYTHRKLHGSTPKEEWAYINFIQKFMKRYPTATRDKSLTAWEQERLKHVKIVEKIIQNLK